MAFCRKYGEKKTKQGNGRITGVGLNEKYSKDVIKEEFNKIGRGGRSRGRWRGRERNVEDEERLSAWRCW